MRRRPFAVYRAYGNRVIATFSNYNAALARVPNGGRIVLYDSDSGENHLVYPVSRMSAVPPRPAGG